MKYNDLKAELQKSFLIHANRCAVSLPNVKYTYNNLYLYIERIKSVVDTVDKTSSNILSFMDRGADSIACLSYAVLENKIFCPVEMKKDDKSILDIIREQKSNLAFTDEKNAERISLLNKNHSIGLCIVVLNFAENFIAMYDNAYSAVETAKFDSDIQYIYYTSGSEGHSKAVMGRKSSLYSFLNWEINKFGITRHDRFLQMTNPNFDPYLRDVLVPLLSGAAIVIPTQSDVIDLRHMSEYIDDHSITAIHMVPSIFRKMMNYDDIFVAKSLRFIFLAGEMLFGKDVKRFYDRKTNNTVLVNLYGPTETTLAKFFHVVTAEDGDPDIVPVGSPIGRTKAKIVNENNEEVPNGREGEIIIETYEASAGYFNMESEQSSFRFFTDGMTEYHTRDKGLIRPNSGELEVRGRLNSIIKIRGQKVDLDHIAQIIKQMSFVDGCCVLDITSSSDNVILAAAVTVKTQKDKSEAKEEIQNFIRSNENIAVKPAVCVIYDEFPLNTNGKVNRNQIRGEIKNTVLQPLNAEAGNDVLSQMTEILNSVIGGNCISQLQPSDRFIDVGVDSLSMFDVILNVEEKYGVAIDETKLELSELKISDIVKMIDEKEREREIS